MKPWEYTVIIWGGAVLAVIGAATTVYGVLATGGPDAAMFLGGPTLLTAAAAGIAATARREVVAERDARDLAAANERENSIRRV